MDVNDLRGRRAVVMGLGRFGGGVGAARFLAQRGARVLVTDQADAATLRDSVAQLADLPGIDWRLGEHIEVDFTTADLIVANPAVKPGNAYLRAARDAGVAVTSEIRLLVRLLPNRQHVVGITGTAGKSTVTAMIAHALKRSAGGSSVWVTGNIGGSLLPQVERIKATDWVVIELSSFMLEGLREDRWSPHVAVLTNFAPNHLDWHGGLDAYRMAKETVFAFQREVEGDVAVVGPGVRESFTLNFANVREVAAPAKPMDLPLPGAHNQLNAALAVTAVEALVGARQTGADQTLGDFVGLPHRLQLVAEHAGVRYYNDSKATTPDAAMLAISSFSPGSVHVVLGGSSKGSDLSDLAHHAAQRCAAVYTIGQVGDALADAAEAAPQRRAEIVRCGDLDGAMRAIVQRVRRGDAVVLSPGCASYDQFANYEQRGERFVEAVLRHTTETGVTPGQSGA